jgi:hypothetical protein
LLSICLEEHIYHKRTIEKVYVVLLPQYIVQSERRNEEQGVANNRSNCGDENRLNEKLVYNRSVHQRAHKAG